MSTSNTLSRLLGIIEATLKMPPHQVDVDADLESLGINSLIMMELIGNIDVEFGVALTPALLIEVTTLSELATLLEGLQPVGSVAGGAMSSDDVRSYIKQTYAVELPERSFDSLEEIADALIEDHADELSRHYGSLLTEQGHSPASAPDIAIVGISCRLPDAPDARTFWRNLLAGKNSAREIPKSRWDWQTCFSSVPSPGKTVSKWGALIDDVDCFDAGFFDIPPSEAMAMDPQQRLLLQETYRAIEDAGINTRTLAGSKTGVFVGYQYSEYEQHLRRLGNQDVARGPLFSSSSPSYYLANRVSFAFDFRGPSESFNVNCASSAVAINRACGSLLSDESDIAVAGGVSLNLFEGDYIASSQYGLLSADGSSGVFDDAAKGFTRGEGVAVIVLKRLADAEKNNDRIYAVIKATQQNYRGAARSLSEVKYESITDVLTACYQKAAVDPETVRYIEVDGYATKWADSLEYEGVKGAITPSKAQGAEKWPRCALGSVKGNIGNVEAASGVTSVIKLALSLYHKKFPATISKRRLNSFIDIDSATHPLYIADQVIAFEDIREGDTPIRAGVNSFADSGTNVHLLLEEYLAGAQVMASEPRARRLFVLSAKDARRLEAHVQQTLDYLSSADAPASFADLVYTAQVGREALDERLAIVAASRAELIEKLALIRQSHLGAGLESKDIYRGSASAAERNPLANLITSQMARMQLAESIRTQQWKQTALLWVNGVELPWNAVWADTAARPVSMPCYPFARDRYWIDVEPGSDPRSDQPAALAVTDVSERQPRADLSEASRTAANASWYIYPLAADSATPTDALALSCVEKIELFLRQETARLLRRPVDDIARDRSLIDLGMNSIGIAGLIQKIDALLDISLSPVGVFKHPQIGALASYLATSYPERIDALVISRIKPAADDAIADAAEGISSGAPGDILIAVQTSGDKEPIFAVPGAGGNALSLHQLSHALGNDQPFFCLEPVGLDGRCAPLASVEQIAEFNIEKLRSVQPRGPYRLLGYSNGGVVAFEMARQLFEHNEKVSGLAMIDTLCPTIRDGHAIEEMVVAVFNRFASSLGVRSSIDVRTLQQVSEAERSAYLYELLVKQGVPLNRQTFQASFNVATASERVCRAYQPSRLTRKLDVTLFKASDGYAGAPKDYGWGGFFAGLPRICPIEATHFSIVEKDAAAEIARKMRAPAGKSSKRMSRAELAVSA